MPKGWKLQRFYHTVINAKDLQRSVDFYASLGFEVLHDRRHIAWPENLAAMFGLKKGRGGGVLMVAPLDEQGSPPTMLDIIEWKEPLAEFPDPAKRGETVPRLFAFKVDNVQAAYDDLKARGVTFTEGAFLKPEGMMTIGAIFFYDPDGNLIELVELKPGARHSQDFKKT
jgi:catechol 2,3-dioxygenase-like lactoylglutathione lyase family enzyme